LAPTHANAGQFWRANRRGNPVLLRVDYQAGHGIGNTKEQRERETADQWSFLMWQMGVAGFQPLAAK
jgi:prolyl oligopeptidase